MFIAIYEGCHFLDLYASFCNAAWSGIYSGYSDDPLAQCLSNFVASFERIGVKVGTSYSWSNSATNLLFDNRFAGPYIFIVSGYTTHISIETILQYVSEGSNFVILSLPHLMVINKEEEEKHHSFIGNVQTAISHKFKDNYQAPYGLGKVFYLQSGEIDDLGIEPGPFGGPSETSKGEKYEQIGRVVTKLSTFDIPCIDCVLKSVPSLWPKDQPLVFEIEVLNRSSTIVDYARVDLDFVHSLEPVSSTSVDIYKLRPNSRRLVTVLIVPREQGKITNPMYIWVTQADSSEQIYIPDFEIEIADNLHKLLRFSESSYIDLDTLLPRYKVYLDPLTTPTALVRLANADPDAAVAKVRRIGEFLAKSIGNGHISGYSDSWTFARVTSELHRQHIIDSKAKGYIDHIRTLGNQASHAGVGEVISFDKEDALQVCYALVLFLKEVTGTGLL
jgi:hypothetical protein